MTGVDTTLPSANGLNGADEPHGGLGQNPDGVERWEWDGSDGGGFNQGLLWFDIPQSVLDAVAISASTVQATLALHCDNNGDSGDVHRITVDWLSGPDGGDNVTFNNFPNGPGIVPGVNAREEVSLMTGVFLTGVLYELDVTADLVAWASGEPNYGWGFLPTGGDGNGITSFESTINPVPTLTVSGISTSGDFNADGNVDAADFDILVANFNTQGASLDSGDMTFDGKVDLEDFTAFRNAFGAGGATAAAVPEPNSFALLGVGTLLLAGLRRKR